MDYSKGGWIPDGKIGGDFGTDDAKRETVTPGRVHANLKIDTTRIENTLREVRDELAKRTTPMEAALGLSVGAALSAGVGYLFGSALAGFAAWASTTAVLHATMWLLMRKVRGRIRQLMGKAER